LREGVGGNEKLLSSRDPIYGEIQLPAPFNVMGWKTHNFSASRRLEI
jgi:hypothetical protein